ncbi:hypothetical protein F2Q68_00035577 [Brassica cretica]|uniref:Uncharacterized protein n=1 Tax=Brassica cretica TaxID=69181 RepID=A0A8S9H4B6_BRACR|nr:hypothetical protein F2Q68_00035577 [Brassica cretica]
MTISMAILSSRWVSSTKQRWLSRWVSATKGNGKGFLIDQAKRGPLSLSVANGKEEWYWHDPWLIYRREVGTEPLSLSDKT